jgi:hypothetical protein
MRNHTKTRFHYVKTTAFPFLGLMELFKRHSERLRVQRSCLRERLSGMSVQGTPSESPKWACGLNGE